MVLPNPIEPQEKGAEMQSVLRSVKKRKKSRQLGEPEIINREELIIAMVENYPPLLRQAGIGGVVRVFFFIDDEGRVKATQLDRSSGFVELDEAALAVAGLYRFRPALNRDQRVPVWVSFPIEFAVR